MYIYIYVCTFYIYTYCGARRVLPPSSALTLNLALTILNMGLISAIMSLGVHLQWGFAGLCNVGVMGFVALGGLAAVLVGTVIADFEQLDGDFEGGLEEVGDFFF